MTNALSWFLIAASLTAGWLLVAWSVRELAAAQEIARRFRSMILPASGLPRMDRYGLVRLLGRKASDAAPELHSLLGRAGFPEPEALLIFCGVRLTATLAAVLAVRGPQAGYLCPRRGRARGQQWSSHDAVVDG